MNLKGSLAEAREGRGQMIFVTAEAGAGKSRFARGVEAMAAAAGMEVLAGRAIARISPAPFRPIAEALAGGLRNSRGGEIPELRSLAPLLGQLVTDGASGADVLGSPVIIGELVLRVLRALGGNRGCLLVLEDLHWADPDSLDIVEYLADNVASEKLLCVATLRSDEPAAAATLIAALAGRRAATVVSLAPLDDAAIDRMIRATLGDGDIAPELLSFVRARADGLPFLAEELLVGLARSGALARTPEGWSVTQRLVPAVPFSFADNVERRLKLTTGDVERVVSAAAVLSRRFDSGLVAACTGMDERAAASALREAAYVHLLTREGDSFGFRHALTRDVIRNRLLPPELSRIASRALEAVECRYPGLPGEWCELAAELAELAGDESHAARLALEAGVRAVARGALSGAIATLDRARLLAAGSGSLELDTSEALAEALALAGDTRRAEVVAAETLAGFVELGAEPGRPVRLYLALARSAVQAGEWSNATRSLDEARARLTPGGDGERQFLAHLDALAAHVALAQGDPATAVALAQTAATAAAELEIPEVECESLEIVGRCLRLNDLRQAETTFERAEAIAARADLPLWRLRALHELGTIDLLDTNRDDRLLLARDAAAAAGAMATLATVELQLSAVASGRFDVDGTHRAAQACVQISRRLGLATLGVALVHVGLGYALAGDRDRMEAALAEALAASHDDTEVAIAGWARARVMASLREGDRVRAREDLDRALERAGTRADITLRYRGLWALLCTLERIDDRNARDQARRAPGSMDRVNRTFLDMADAVAAGREQGPSEAGRRFALADRELARFEGAEWLREIARWLVAHAAIEDGWGEPQPWLRQALVVFEEMGHDGLAASCRALLRKSGSPVPRQRGTGRVPATLRSAGVTSREYEVLVLVGERLSNREVAARLHLSPRTVERHVANLLSKLAVKRRSDLAEVLAAGPDLR